MEDDANRSADRRLSDILLGVASGQANDQESFDSGIKEQTKRNRSSRSKSRGRDDKSPNRNRRRRSYSRSRSRGFSSDRDRRRRRYEERDPRLRQRPVRGRGRSPLRLRDRRDRSFSRERSRSNSRNRNMQQTWSPNKKGPVSPPIPQPPQPPTLMNPAYTMNQPPPQLYNENYNYTNPVQYGPSMPNTQYPPYDYTMQQQQPFVGYQQPPVQLQPVPPGDDFANSQWNVQQNTLVPPPAIIMPQQQTVPVSMPIIQESEEDIKKRNAAIAEEKKNQRATLRKQREDYKRRLTALNRELKILQVQRGDLVSSGDPPSPTTKGFLKENDRLQSQIENKISTIESVIDMLTGIIGNDKSPTPPSTSLSSSSSSRKSKKKSVKSEDDSSPERLKTKAMETIKKKGDSKSSDKDKDKDKEVKDKEKENKKEKKIHENSSGGTRTMKADKIPEEVKVANQINYVHYDPEMHWCKLCDVFPKTAKDYLTHLHTKEHQNNQKTFESPWHEKPFKDEMPNYPGAQTKRTPIRGLQFFVPSTGWYCKLCSIWMGDLHCASLHLKSQTHADRYYDYATQNPHYEIDWMADRQKAYENLRENPVQVPVKPSIVPAPSPAAHLNAMLIPTPVPPPAANILDSIPLQLQINNQKLKLPIIEPDVIKDSEKKKKKKKKHDEKKEKKKKKRSKKRKHETSSSSSSSDNSSDSDVEKSNLEKNKEDTSHSIRVAMRNLLKKQTETSSHVEDKGGKWTVVQPAQLAAAPPPHVAVNANGREINVKDDIIINQWNVPEPIITDKEKQLLEQLKGRLKNRSNEKDTKAEVETNDKLKVEKKVERDRDRERERDHDKDRDRDRGTKRSRDGSKDRRRDRSRSRSRDRHMWRSRSRNRRTRSRSRSGGRYGRRRTRSRSRGRRLEKAIVRYPEFRPRVPEKEKEKEKDKDKKKVIKSDSSKDRKKSPSSKKSASGNTPTSITNTTSSTSTYSGNTNTTTTNTTTSLTTSATTKKLPFIGRMPVFKKQTNEEEIPVNKKVETVTPTFNNHQYSGSSYPYDNMQPMMMDDYDDLMPDPMQFVSLMGAPPPPPMVPPPIIEEGPVLPPGIDEADADLVPKPISDAPLPRRGPLPQDFQDALSIIFPGEKKQSPTPEEEKEKENENENITNIIEDPQMIIMPDEHVQHNMDIYVSFPMVSAQPMPADVPIIISTDAPPPPPEDIPIPDDFVVGDETFTDQFDEHQKNLEDLAMLGIDADDLAAQCM